MGLVHPPVQTEYGARTSSCHVQTEYGARTSFCHVQTEYGARTSSCLEDTGSHFFCSLKDRIVKAMIECRLVQKLRIPEDLLSLIF